MPGERYCEPCKRLFSGKAQSTREDLAGINFIHHSDANSLKDALRLPCSICSFGWHRKANSPAWHDSISYGTTGRLFARGSDLVTRVRFYYGDAKRCFQSLCLAPYEDMTRHLFPSLLPDNTRSGLALNFLLSKYKECRDKHIGCRLQSSSIAVYPSRVLYIGGLENNLIYLRDTQDFNNRGAYICLSHCWGQKNPLMLTKETKLMLQDGILISALPKTFQDAIFVTRLLGIQFLWIDSLCIFQDCKADWESEASHMGDIYSQAACTIAATAAKDSDSGLFTKRTPTLLQPRCIKATWISSSDAMENNKFTYPQAGLYWCDINDLWTEAIERAPLGLRAWVCQERHLSPRIMHFTDSQLFWECHAGRACENYPNGLPEWTNQFWCNDSSVLRQNLYQLRLQEANITAADTGTLPVLRQNLYQPRLQEANITVADTGTLLKRELYFSWTTFRIHYTQCALTKEEDKLVAINGIAQQLGQALNDQLIAGLWYNCMLEELCWYKRLFGNDIHTPRYEPTKWRAPTWSWASSNATIWVSNTTIFHRDCKNKQIWGKLENLDVKLEVSGELEHASLQIRCKPISAIFIESPPPDRDNEAKYRYQAFGVLTFQNSMVNIQVQRSDNNEVEMDDLEREEICNVHMIVIQRCPHHQAQDRTLLADCVEGLLLVPQQEGHDVFKRVGLFTVQGSATVAKVLEEYEAAESKIITLI